MPAGGPQGEGAGGTLVEHMRITGGPLVARIDIDRSGLYLEMVMSVLDDLSVVEKLGVRAFI